VNFGSIELQPFFIAWFGLIWLRDLLFTGSGAVYFGY
jgi:hypothetical protein